MSDVQSTSSSGRGERLLLPDLHSNLSAGMDEFEMITGELSSNYASLTRASSGESRAGFALAIGNNFDGAISGEGDSNMGWGGSGGGRINSIGDGFLGLFNSAEVQHELNGILGSSYISGAMVPEIKVNGGPVEDGDIDVERDYGDEDLNVNLSGCVGSGVIVDDVNMMGHHERSGSEWSPLDNMQIDEEDSGYESYRFGTMSPSPESTGLFNMGVNLSAVQGRQGEGVRNKGKERLTGKSKAPDSKVFKVRSASKTCTSHQKSRAKKITVGDGHAAVSSTMNPVDSAPESLEAPPTERYQLRQRRKRAFDADEHVPEQITPDLPRHLDLPSPPGPSPSDETRGGLSTQSGDSPRKLKRRRHEPSPSLDDTSLPEPESPCKFKR
ncbi:hypothetical protein HDU76_002534 [Blyttiomyces sp. JEL0837]|nr:hypothetical protein HDU76_002534 [Blyttiomyces sp. JEL0837]